MPGKWLAAVIALFIFLLGTPALAEEEEDNGLPVPRFVSLRSGEVNMRIGPGTRYSINWVYKREGLPVEILQEFDPWRKVRDAEGTTGWVHKQMLQGRRMGQVIRGVAVLRKLPDAHSVPVARMEPGVLGRMIECEKDWCRMQVAGRKGWVEKLHLWGVFAKEEF